MRREGRALLYALKRIGRSRLAVGKRLLFLVDNMAVCLAFSRFRAKSFGPLVIIRKFAAWCLCRRIFPSIRWIPSERNSADAPSRYLDFLHRSEPSFTKRVVQPHVSHESKDNQTSSQCKTFYIGDKNDTGVSSADNDDADSELVFFTCTRLQSGQVTRVQNAPAGSRRRRCPEAGHEPG